jgi:magnesium chelatase family protein
MTSPHFPSAPGTGRAYGAVIIGVGGHSVETEAVISNGPPAFSIAGLPETSVRETRDRIRAAILNSGQPWPAGSVTVNLLPASLPKHGAGLDLAIAVAVLTAAAAVPASAADKCVFVAELGLDGSLRPVRGVLPALIAAASAAHSRAVVAAGNGAEAQLVPGMAVAACQSLRAVLAWLRGQPSGPHALGVPTASRPAAPDTRPVISLAGLAVGPLVRLVLEAAAAGGHHLCLTGSRGPAIPALAAGLAGLLPPLDASEAMEVTTVHSVAGLLNPAHAVITRPPLRVPHHTATPAAMVGGGTGMTRPGEAALAHRGVLFLQDAPEFAAGALQLLRQPLQDGQVTVAHSGRTVRFPAKFILVASTAACPCGAGPGCGCSPQRARRYRARFARELGSYTAIWLQAPSGPAVPAAQAPGAEADVASAARVAAARQRARRRLDGTPWRLNADIPGAELRRSFRPAAEALAPISRAVDLGRSAQARRIR